MMPTLTIRLNTLLLVLLVFMAAAIIAILATRSTAGPLDPPASPASTLPQVEPRMPIPPVGWNGTFPITISQSGSYFFTRDLVGTTGVDGIDIPAGDVTLDLNGFTLSNDLSGMGIYNNGSGNVTIHGGLIRGWSDGISASGLGHITLEDCKFEANSLAAQLNEVATVKNCLVANSLGDGIDLRETDSAIEDTAFIHDAANGGLNTALYVSGGGAVIRGNRFSSDVGSDIDLASSFNLLQSNTWKCNGVILANGVTGNSTNIDFAKDGTNVCFP